MDEDSRDPQAAMAEIFEAYFLKHGGRSLTNPETAAVFRTTLDAFLFMLKNAHANGTISQEQYDTLRGMTDGMRAVPDVLSPNA